MYVVSFLLNQIKIKVINNLVSDWRSRDFFFLFSIYVTESVLFRINIYKISQFNFIYTKSEQNGFCECVFFAEIEATFQ